LNPAGNSNPAYSLVGTAGLSLFVAHLMTLFGLCGEGTDNTCEEFSVTHGGIFTADS